MVAGWQTDIRLVTALAIAPFAQMLNTGTFYGGAVYVFYSEESTLSILQMSVLIGVCLWGASRVADRTGRHLMILAIMGFVVANLCALVGSLWGDVIGESWFGPQWSAFAPEMPEGGSDWTTEQWTAWEAQREATYAQFEAAREAFRNSTLVISDRPYSVLWAVALAALILWSAFTARRGLFNASVTFAAIHGYTQMFESFADEPLAYVVLGLATIPLAWGAWRANLWLMARGR